jgi:uncharacterized protein (DUF433 family)
MSTVLLSFVAGGGRWDEVVVFTSEQVQRVTGISKRKLDYWLQTEVLWADIDAARGRGRVRLYSFQNLVEIRTAIWLRDMVSLQLLRKVVAKLREVLALGHPLAEVSFGVILTDRRREPYHVVVQGADGVWEHWESGQRIMEISLPIHSFVAELTDAAERDRLGRRRPGKVERRRGVMGSTPVLAGTRVPTRAIWSLYRSGYDVDRILANYPGLTPMDVDAAVAAEQDRPRDRVVGA